MSDETTNKIADVITAMAKELGTTAAYLWPRMVGHKAAEAYTGMGIGLLCTLVLGFLLWRTVRGGPLLDEKEQLEPRGFVAVVLALLTVVSVVVTLDVIGTELPDALYPEAAVIQELLHEIRQ